MLHPAEASDDLGFPPWLRVYWRKSHPEIDLSGPQPGYPLQLARVHEWMVDHPNSLADAQDGTPGQPSGPKSGGSGG